jgi:hypothetical protein
VNPASYRNEKHHLFEDTLIWALTIALPQYLIDPILTLIPTEAVAGGSHLLLSGLPDNATFNTGTLLRSCTLVIRLEVPTLVVRNIAFNGSRHTDAREAGPSRLRAKPPSFAYFRGVDICMALVRKPSDWPVTYLNLKSKRISKRERALVGVDIEVDSGTKPQRILAGKPAPHGIVVPRPVVI